MKPNKPVNYLSGVRAQTSFTSLRLFLQCPYILPASTGRLWLLLYYSVCQSSLCFPLFYRHLLTGGLIRQLRVGFPSCMIIYFSSTLECICKSAFLLFFLFFTSLSLYPTPCLFLSAFSLLFLSLTPCGVAFIVGVLPSSLCHSVL